MEGVETRRFPQKSNYRGNVPGAVIPYILRKRSSAQSCMSALAHARV